MLGDFNAAIGSETSALMPKIVESHTIGDETSRNGMLLSEWCLERKLRIENTFFRKLALRACTWRHQRLGELSLKDYAIISAGKGKTFLSIDATRSSWSDSYHSDLAMLIVVGRATVMSKRAKVRKAKARTESIRRKTERILDSARELAKLRDSLSNGA